MIFQNDEHKRFFERCIKRAGAENDPERRALFYTLGLTEETRKNINSLYDFKENLITPEGVFEKPWQTSTSVATTRLAYNLYNGFNGLDGHYDDPNRYAPCNLFCNELTSYYFEAVKIRFPEYCRDMNATEKIQLLDAEYIRNGGNGNIYRVLDRAGDDTLLELTKKSLGGQYVVAYRLSGDNDNCTWDQGHYFERLPDAAELFKQRNLGEVKIGDEVTISRNQYQAIGHSHTETLFELKKVGMNSACPERYMIACNARKDAYNNGYVDFIYPHESKKEAVAAFNERNPDSAFTDTGRDGDKMAQLRESMAAKKGLEMEMSL